MYYNLLSSIKKTHSGVIDDDYSGIGVVGGVEGRGVEGVGGSDVGLGGVGIVCGYKEKCVWAVRLIPN